MMSKKVRREKSKSSFLRLTLYLLDVKHHGTKVDAIRITNCASEDPLWAAREVVAVQNLNKRSKVDHTYHLVVSFREGDALTGEILRDVEDTIVNGLGLGAHQRVSVVHRDTRNPHLHIAINKVHPVTHRCVEPYYDYPRRDALCQELEQRHSLQRDNRRGQPVRPLDIGTASPSGRPGDLEAHGGAESLLGWLRRHSVELKREAQECKSWDEFADMLGRWGLELQKRGAGLSWRSIGTATAVKPSQVSRAFSIKALTARFGPLNDLKETIPGVAPSNALRVYKDRPLERTPLSEKLYAQYQRERVQALAARDALREAQEVASRAHAEDVRKWYVARRRSIRAVPGSREKKRLSYHSLGIESRRVKERQQQVQRDERAALQKSQPLVRWRDFLRQRAERGDVEALEVLRLRKRRSELTRVPRLTGTDPELSHVLLESNLNKEVRQDGTVVYSLSDGGRVHDERRQVSVEHITAGSVSMALRLASRRFPGQSIVVDGPEEFTRQVRDAAQLSNIPIVTRREAQQGKVLKQHKSLTKGMAPPSSGVIAWIADRNRMRERISDIYYHRLWVPADAGEVIYRGRRHAGDTEVVLLEHGREMLVMPVTHAQAAKASTWQLGKVVLIDDRQRFRERSGQRRDRE